MPYGEQVLWPDHCIQGSLGAAFHSALNTGAAHLIIRKGFRSHIDSYSAFFENDKTTTTGLSGYLQNRGVERVFLTGLATEFCVGFSALDAVAAGFDAVVLEDATRALGGEHLEMMLEKQREAGVSFTTTAAIS